MFKNLYGTSFYWRKRRQEGRVFHHTYISQEKKKWYGM